MPTNTTKGETTRIMCLLLKYKPLPSKVVMPTHGNKGKKENKSKSLDPITNEQSAWQNNMLNHKDATSKSH